jgi:hypothetical protein
LGEFLPNFGRFFTSGTFVFSLLSPQKNNKFFDKKSVGLHFGRFFTNSSGHPECHSSEHENNTRQSFFLKKVRNFFSFFPRGVTHTFHIYGDG